MKKVNKSKLLSYATGGLLSFIGISGVIVGLLLVIEPDGRWVGLNTDLLKNTPFVNFMIPGILLFAVNGVGSLIGTFLVLKKHHNNGIATIFLGVAMIIWISAEVYWFGWISSGLQITFLVVGVVEVVLGYFLHEQDRHRAHIH